MADLATNLNDGGSVMIHIAAVAVGGIAGYVVGSIARSAFEDAISWANSAKEKATDAISLDLDFGDSLDFLGPGGLGGGI